MKKLQRIFEKLEGNFEYIICIYETADCPLTLCIKIFDKWMCISAPGTIGMC